MRPGFDTRSGFVANNGQRITSGSLVECKGRNATVDHVYQDGDADITYDDDGTHASVKWHMLDPR